MNRQILFRGKAIDGGAWIEGFYTGVYEDDDTLPGGVDTSKLRDLAVIYTGRDDDFIEVDPATVQVKAGDFWFGTDELANIVVDSPQYKMLKLAATQN